VNEVKAGIDHLKLLRRHPEGKGLIGSKTLQQKIKRMADKFKLENGSLWRKKKSQWKRVIETETERTRIISEFHNNGHQAKDTVFDNISRNYWWPGMYTQVAQQISDCEGCARQRGRTQIEEDHPIEVTGVGDRWQIDFVGPLLRTGRKNRYILVAVEVVTRWPEAVPCKAATGNEVVKFLEGTLLPRFGCPAHIQTDQGSHFKNHEVAKFTRDNGIQHHFSSAYHPQSNGIVERQNQTLARMLARHGQETNWDLNIGKALLAYRSTRHAITKYSPSQLMYGWNMRLPIQVQIPGLEDTRPVDQEVTQHLRVIEDDLPRMRQAAIDNTTTHQSKRPKTPPSERFKVGDQVYRHRTQLQHSHSNKLGSKWDGPFKIIDVLDKGTYRLETIEVEPKVLSAPVHGSRLQRCNRPVLVQ